MRRDGRVSRPRPSQLGRGTATRRAARRLEGWRTPQNGAYITRMSDTDATVQIDGVLSRVTQHGEIIELRFVPFTHKADPAADPVLVVRLTAPDSAMVGLDGLQGEEVAVTVFPDRITLYAYLHESERTWLSPNLSHDWVGYDVIDLSDHLRKMEAEVGHLHGLLSQATRKLNQGMAITEELYRRAEIKAAASDAHREKQAAALAVLGRLLRHFKDDV